jgi:zinc transporter ZupT
MSAKQPQSGDALDVNTSLVVSILIGDGFHNFCNGVFIGTAFETCGSNDAWVVAAATVFHELSQELASFLLLTKQGNLSAAAALGINCISGSMCLLGTAIVYGGDPDAAAVGCLLAYGAGTCIYIATVPIFPQIANNLITKREMAWHLVLFVLGAVCIGLVLLRYGGCAAEEAAHTPGGHAH